MSIFFPGNPPPAPNHEHHEHHAHHSLEDDNRRSSDRKSIEFSSPLAKPSLASPSPTPLKSLKSVSAPVVCPVCGVRSMTITTEKSGGFTFATAGIACLVSCAILSWVPFVISETKDILHLCGNCKVHLAHWHRRGRIEILAYPEVNKDENKDGE